MICLLVQLTFTIMCVHVQEVVVSRKTKWNSYMSTGGLEMQRTVRGHHSNKTHDVICRIIIGGVKAVDKEWHSSGIS